MSEPQTRSVQQLMDLSGRTALVTGGSRGLGLQMAQALGEAGARLVISSRKANELEEAAEQLRAAGIDVTPLAVDLSDEDAVMGLADRALEVLGRVDILVNNAGASWGAPAEDYPLEGWDKVMTLNVRNLFMLTREIGRRSMIPNGGGRVVNVASNAALGGNRDFMQAVGYNTSKGAVVTFTRALAAEWGAYNITVNAIGPGVFPSKMSRYLTDRHGVEALAARVPLNRVGDEEDLKGTVLLFASDAGKHITGQFLVVDGGASAMIAG
ncbi:SDR family oxidoreductase [Alloalcanivorax venustensis]|jgi:gluconate 5-dehydrogenase|uniref:SDR family oxidoreductase n=1 Tax=Alloalcanivorax venustensis TaxID=172371 RepID=UPI0039E293FE